MTRERADFVSLLVVLAVTLVLAAAVAIWWAHLASAQPAVAPPREQSESEPDGPASRATHAARELAGGLDRRLALAIAKVAVNEASLARCRPADVGLIAQVTLARGSTDAARLAWLSRHSSCVLTSRPMRARERRSNCAWSRHLDDTDAQPAGWPEALPWSAYVERWRDARRLAHRYVLGIARQPFPCTETPRTWGSRTLDLESALRRGLRPVACTTTGNVGFVRR